MKKDQDSNRRTMASGVSRDPELDGQDDVLCPCVELRKGDLQEILSADPNVTFEDLMSRTGAGGKCTACLLDLEYFYTILPRDRARASLEMGRDRRAVESRSLKQRLYGFIDRLSPATPMPLTEYMPVLYGAGIEEWVCIANHSMLYEGSTCAPDTDVRLIVRNAGGQEVHREKLTVVPGEARRVLVSSHLTSSGSASPGIGSVQVSRRSHWPGIRGTTRPQVEIVTAAGSCAVHTQAPGRTRDRWLSVYHRPSDERLFASAVNASSAPLVAEIAYPYAPADSMPVEPVVQHVEVPPYGAVLHEIVLPEATSHALHGKLYSIRLNTNGLGKMHLFCSTPNLDRFSIDHL